MFENFILGIIQGIAEWLPVSSEGMLVLTQTHFFPSSSTFEDLIRKALLLHFGTFLAALVYFWGDVCTIIKGCFNKNKSPQTSQLIQFLAISTVISGCIGIILIKTLMHIVEQYESSTQAITLLVAVLLIITAMLELKSNKSGYRQINDLKVKDSIILGIVQGFAALPGFSRSGFTVSALLLSKFDKAVALKLSFLMSLPIVLIGNIMINFSNLTISIESCTGILSSFLFGLLTIHLLLKIPEKINFGYFLLIFAALTIASVFI